MRAAVMLLRIADGVNGPKYSPGPCGARMHARSADGTLHTANFFRCHRSTLTARVTRKVTRLTLCGSRGRSLLVDERMGVFRGLNGRGVGPRRTAAKCGRPTARWIARGARRRHGGDPEAQVRVTFPVPRVVYDACMRRPKQTHARTAGTKTQRAADIVIPRIPTRASNPPPAEAAVVESRAPGTRGRGRHGPDWAVCRWGAAGRSASIASSCSRPTRRKT